MLELPAWYQGGFYDAEQLVMSYFEWLLGESVFVCSWLPPGHYTLTPGEEVGGTQPTLRVWRQPGRADYDLRRDQALVQIAAITPTRKESWELVEFVRRMMEHDVVANFPIVLPDGKRTSLSCSEEWMGPQLVPERIVDEKFIPVTFKVGVRESSNLPKYRQILNSLP